MTFNRLRANIRNEIGINAFAPFEDQYAPDDEVLRILVDVVIVAFLSGFFDFESLGKSVAQRVDGFMTSFWASPRFWESPQLISLNISGDIDKALTQASPPDEVSKKAATERLIRMLVEYGMSEEIAKAHAAVIEQSVLAALPTSAE